MKRGRGKLAIILAATACAGWAGFTLWNASTALKVAEYEAASASDIRIVVTELKRVETGVEPISSPSRFHDAFIYRGDVYAAGSAGLFTGNTEYRVGDLLPPAPLTSMAEAITSQSAEPELWIGSAGEGMLSFDGSRFRHVRPADARFRDVTSVLGSKVGRVLFGTKKAGVLAFNGKTLSVLHESLGGMHVTALAGDETELWIGTIDRGLLRWRAGQVTAIEGLPDKHILSIARDGDTVYAGTALGVAVIRSTGLERILAPDLFARTLYASKGRLYAGTIDAGIYDIPVQSGRPRFIETGAPVHRMLEADGHLLAISDGGVFEARHGGAVLKPGNAVLADGNISSLAMDLAGQLWVGYFDRGLDILDPSFTQTRHFEDQHLFCVNRILHGRTAAVATANGLVLFDTAGQKRQVLGRAQGLIANHVTDVAWNGDEMVAATPAGLSFIGPDGIRSLYAFHGLVNNHAYAVGVANGRVLAGTLGGLSMLESGAVRVSYTTSNSPLRHNWITAIASAGADAYIGTYGAGVVRLAKDGTWESFADMPASVEVNPGAMATSGTHVYAGTLGKGLLVYDLSGRRWNTMTRGLPSMNVTAVHVANGRVYVGTDNGLVRLP